MSSSDLLFDFLFFFFNDTATTEIYTLSLHDALPISGKLAEETLDKVGITCNKNTIPFDKEKPFVTSGVRLGTPAATTQIGRAHV